MNFGNILGALMVSGSTRKRAHNAFGSGGEFSASGTTCRWSKAFTANGFHFGKRRRSVIYLELAGSQKSVRPLSLI